MTPLADLVTYTAKVKDIPAAAIPALLVQIAAVQTSLAARLQEEQGEAIARELSRDGAGDRWLTIEEAHSLSGLGVRWLYRHWKRVPGAKKFSPRRLRFHEPAFQKWLKKGA